MDPNEHRGAAPEPEQPADGSPAQPHGEGRPDGGSPVAGLAGEFGAELVRAIRVGLAEVSSSAHGSRGSSQLSWYAFAIEYARAHWPGRAAKTRDEVSDALTAVTLAMCWDFPGRPKEQVLRRALRHWAFVAPGVGRGEMPAEDRMVLQWVAKASRPLVDLLDPVLARDVLESLRRKLDGGEAAVETMRRKRKVLVHALHYAVERGELGSHPLAKIRWRVPKPAVGVDPRVVANPYQARDLLSAVSYVGGYRRARGRRLVGLFAGMYYAGLRPEEAIAVALPDCRLPSTGWGRLIVHRTLPQAGKRWTDTGQFHDERGLKNRPPGETRVVPLPPRLVALWRDHLRHSRRRTAVLQRTRRHPELQRLPLGLARSPCSGAAARPLRDPAREAPVRPAALGAVHMAVRGRRPGRGRPAGRQQRRGPPVPVREVPVRPAVHQQPAHRRTPELLRPPARGRSVASGRNGR